MLLPVGLGALHAAPMRRALPISMEDQDLALPAVGRRGTVKGHRLGMRFVVAMVSGRKKRHSSLPEMPNRSSLKVDLVDPENVGIKER